MANGITDTPVLMAAKSHLRNENSLVIGIATDDGLARERRKYREIIKQKTYIFYPI